MRVDPLGHGGGEVVGFEGWELGGGVGREGNTGVWVSRPCLHLTD